MSYIEQGIYWYIKNIILGGIKTLISKQYLFFTVLSISVALLAAFNPIMQRLEVIVALSLIMGAWQPVVFPVAFAVMLFIPGIEGLVWLFLPLWAIFTALVALFIPRDLVDSWGGYGVFFGNPKGHVPFNFVFNLIFIGGVIYSLAFLTAYSVVFLMISLTMLYMTNLFARRDKNDRLGFTLSIFYISIFYYFATINAFSSISGFTVVDTLIALFTLFFAVQGNTRILESKVAPHAAVFLTLGLALGFHAVGSTNLHLYQFVFASVIFPVTIVLFLFSERFENYFTRQPSMTKAVLDFSKGKLENLIKKFGI
jgi:hypothetical protein